MKDTFILNIHLEKLRLRPPTTASLTLTTTATPSCTTATPSSGCSRQVRAAELASVQPSKISSLWRIGSALQTFPGCWSGFCQWMFVQSKQHWRDTSLYSLVYNIRLSGSGVSDCCIFIILFRVCLVSDEATDSRAGSHWSGIRVSAQSQVRWQVFIKGKWPRLDCPLTLWRRQLRQAARGCRLFSKHKGTICIFLY